MNYAVIETGGKQYKVSEGEVVRIEKLSAQEDESIELDKVILLCDDEGLEIGTPYVEGASVKAKVREHGKGKKIIVFKYKPKKRYRKKQGHRQPFTEIEVLEISRGVSESQNEQTAEVSE